MFRERQGERVPCRRPTGGSSALRVRALPGEGVALLDASGVELAVLGPLQVGRLRGALRSAAVRAVWPPDEPEWDGRDESAGWPLS